MKRSSKLTKRNLKKTKKGGAGVFMKRTSPKEERQLSPGTHLMRLDEQIDNLQMKISDYENDRKMISVHAHDLAEGLKRDSYIPSGIQKILKYAMQNELVNQITGKSMGDGKYKILRQKIIHLIQEKKTIENGLDRFHEILASLWKAREIASRQMEREYVNVVKRQRAGGKKRSSRRTKKRYSAYI